MPELKPCPFCGGKAKYNGERGYVAAYVNCETCGATGKKVGLSFDYCAKDKAIEAWNMRNPDVQ